MMRRYVFGTIAGGLTWFGALSLTAQVPTAVPAPAAAPVVAGMPREGDLLTFRTAGQPERRVRILRITGTIDDGLADVQDLSSNAKYSIPLKVLASMARSAATTAPGTVPPAALPAPPLVVTPNPNAGTNGWPKPTAAPSPLVKGNMPRTILPSPTAARALMQETQQVAFAPPSPPPAPASPAASMPPVDATRSVQAAPAKPATTTDDVFFRPASLPSIVPPVQPTSTPTPPPPDAWSKPVPTTPPVRTSTPAAAPAVPVVTTAPIPSNALPPTQPAFSTVKPPVVNVAAPEYVAVPVYDFGAPAVAAPPVVETNLTASSTPVPAVAAPIPADTPPAVAPKPTFVAAPQVVVQTSLTAHSLSIQSELIGADVLSRLPTQMVEELQPYLFDLSRALRPSLRERAASALADGRYGSRPEVKAALARVALVDPAPSVKAHCIRLLSKLGYHESSYLDYLDSCAESADATVKQAAVDAVAKLRTK